MVFTGRLALAAALACALVTAFAPSWLGVLVATAALAALALVDLIATARHRLEFGRDELTTVRLGRSVEVELRVTNHGATTVRGKLWDDWPASAGATGKAARRIVLPPDSMVRLTTTLTPVYRGDRIAGPVTVRLIGPLGCAGRQFRRPAPARVRALPAFRSERLLASRAQRLQHLEGRNLAAIRGQGVEFDSFREYVPGDDVRSIDWRATARTRDVMVRTWRPERNRHVLMLLDTGRVSAGRVGDTTRLDANIEAALLLGGLAAAAGDTVALLAYDRAVRAEVGGIAGKSLQPTLMHAMAGLTPTLLDTDAQGMVTEALRRTRRRSLVVWFTSLDGALVEESLLPVLPVLGRRHHVLVVSATDPDLPRTARARDDAAALYAAAAAESVLAERAVATESLRRKAISVVNGPPDTLPAALADAYLELKRSGRM